MRIALIAATLLIPVMALAQDTVAGLAGVLQDPAGAVIAGAPVILQSETIPERLFRIQSDAVGKFRFATVPPDSYTLIFHLQGFKLAVQDAGVLAAGEQKELAPIRLEVSQIIFKPKDVLEAFDVRLIFPRSDHGDLAGRVVDLGADAKDPGKVAPLAETQLTLLCDESRICGSTRIGADGTFRFPDLTPGLYGLRVQRDGYYSEEFRRVEVNRGVELLYRIYIEPCQKGNCDSKRRVEPQGILL